MKFNEKNAEARLNALIEDYEFYRTKIVDLLNGFLKQCPKNPLEYKRVVEADSFQALHRYLNGLSDAAEQVADITCVATLGDTRRGFLSRALSISENHPQFPKSDRSAFVPWLLPKGRKELAEPHKSPSCTVQDSEKEQFSEECEVQVLKAACLPLQAEDTSG